MKRLSIILLALTALTATSQTAIVDKHRPKGRIVVADNAGDHSAAWLLQTFVKRMSGAELPIVKADGKLKNGDIMVSGRDTTGITTDGFNITTGRDGITTINSRGDRGAVNGAVRLLETLGVNYFGENEYVAPEMATVTLPVMNLTSNPTFVYRQSHNYALRTDSVYRMWMGLKEPNDVFAEGYWVHTFDRLLPSAEYGGAHPEYYSFINGERRPGKASQWCLSNPEVFRIVAERIDSIFEANPGRDYISVSQNDGNHTYCTCELCRAVMEREGGPSGIYIEFLNKLAERRPDKTFSTLAYLFTMHPPKMVKPRENVNIMLCDIDAKREVPLTDNVSGQDFVKALEGWSKIADNIFVWDYGINFDCYLSPFPNFPILQKNMQLFRDNNVKMHFAQINSSRGGDFSEMRTWMISKLMWNVDQNADSLMRVFMDGYYGAAAPYLYEYEKLLEGALLGSNKELWIYDSPVTHKDGMLNKALRKRYDELFDRAEAAVANDKTRLDRVRRQRLTLQFSELEIERAEGHADESTLPKLALFEERVKEYDVPTVNERNNSPIDYVNLYRTRYIRPKGENLAAGAKIEWISEPSPTYKQRGETALTDEIFGGTSYVESWVGWEGKDGAFVIDLGEEKPVSTIEADFLHQLGAWVFFPKSVTYYTSTDGKDYKQFAHIDQPEDRTSAVQFKTLGHTAEKPVEARYVKVEIEGVKICPGWHYGVGSPGWFFCDEVTVK